MAEEPKELSKLKIERGAAKRPGRGKRIPRWLLVVAAVLALLALAWAFGLISPAREVQTASVSRVYPSEGFTELSASGYVVAQRKAAVASKGTGRLEYLAVEEGSRVRKGDVLARLENEDLLAAQRRAEANVNVARAALAQTEAELADAKLNYQRMKSLVAQEVVPRAEYDTAKARYDAALAARRNAHAQVNAAKAALSEARAGLEYTYIRAPFDGVVLVKYADVGDVVAPFGSATNAKASVVTMADMDSLQVEADVSESNIGKVKVGQPAEIELDALPGVRLAGQVHMVVPTADRAKATIMTKVRFLERDLRVLPEMSAKVSFLTRPVASGEERPRLAVPAAALVQKGGRTVAYVIEESQAREVAVQTGQRLGSHVEVISGLKDGQKVALSPEGLSDGAPVKVVAQ